MRSIAHLPPSAGKYAAINADRWTLSGHVLKDRWLVAKVALLAFGMGGFCAFMLLIAALTGAFASVEPVLRIVAVQDDTGRTVRATVEGLAPIDCFRWRDRLGAAIGNAGFTVKSQECSE